MPDGPERIDYRETPDITEVHGAIRREHSDPRADVTPIPLWLTVVCGVAICWAGSYMGAFHGGFSPNVFNERESSPALLFPGTAKQKGAGDTGGAGQSLAAMGKSVYSNCQPCHGAAGAGVPGQFPSLVDAEFVVGGEKRMIAILLKGLQGPLTVHGATFNGAMPAWEKTLTDKKIAAVATYVRSSWGNAASEISEAKVAAARKEFAAQSNPWTAAEISQIPADANLPDAAGAAAPATPAGPNAATPGAPAASATTAPAPAPGAKPAGVMAAADPALIAEGKKNYMLVCVACHQPTGMGLPMVFPPLSKTEYVLGSPERLAAMVLKGNAGPITIDGKPFNNIMPGQEAMLDDAKIAAILTFVRSSFGNNAPPISADVVAAARKKFADRKTPWTEPELKAWKDNGAAAPAPGGGAQAPAPGTPAPAAPGQPAPAPAPAATPESPAPAPAAPANPAPAAPAPNQAVPPHPAPAGQAFDESRFDAAHRGVAHVRPGKSTQRFRG
jgi:mono/diheme cytochrome c family protein